VAVSAKLAKEAGCHHYSLLTATGSNAKIWSSDFILFGALLYMKTKGLVRARVWVERQGESEGLHSQFGETPLWNKNLYGPIPLLRPHPARVCPSRTAGRGGCQVSGLPPGLHLPAGADLPAASAPRGEDPRT
jgi:hypothetical protein